MKLDIHRQSWIYEADDGLRIGWISVDTDGQNIHISTLYRAATPHDMAKDFSTFEEALSWLESTEKSSRELLSAEIAWLDGPEGRN